MELRRSWRNYIICCRKNECNRIFKIDSVGCRVVYGYANTWVSSLMTTTVPCYQQTTSGFAGTYAQLSSIAQMRWLPLSCWFYVSKYKDIFAFLINSKHSGCVGRLLKPFFVEDIAPFTMDMKYGCWWPGSAKYVTTAILISFFVGCFQLISL